jgi:hypothetical protein
MEEMPPKRGQRYGIILNNQKFCTYQKKYLPLSSLKINKNPNEHFAEHSASFQWIISLLYDARNCLLRALCCVVFNFWSLPTPPPPANRLKSTY